MDKQDKTDSGGIRSSCTSCLSMLNPSMSLVLRGRLLETVDDHHINHALLRLQFQAELLLNGGEECWTGVGVAGRHRSAAATRVSSTGGMHHHRHSARSHAGHPV